jgi:hypothetical protein
VVAELAESGASEETITAIVGHVSRRMQHRYSHPRLEAKRRALEALPRLSPQTAAGGLEMAHVTIRVTKPVEAGTALPEVIEKNGRPVGIRTPDLYRVKVAL